MTLEKTIMEGIREAEKKCVRKVNVFHQNNGSKLLTDRQENLVVLGFAEGALYAATIAELFIEESKKSDILSGKEW